MIEKLILRAFKSFVNEELKLGRLTVLTGLNSSGKSSVIQALRMMERVSRGKPLAEVHVQEHGPLAELRNINSQDNDLLIQTSGLSNDTWECRLNINATGGIHRDLFPKTVYIAADRFGPKLMLPALVGDELGEHGENMYNLFLKLRDELMPDKLRLPSAEKNTVESNIKAWLRLISPGVKLDVAAPTRTGLSYALFNGFRSSNVGFGLSYVFPVILSLTWGALGDNRLVMIENPEAHLHPKGQSAMGELISRAADCGAQIVVETHSDHLFDGIRVYVKEHAGFDELVETYWFELDNYGNTVWENPVIEHDGRIKNWPEGMFDQFEHNACKLL